MITFTYFSFWIRHLIIILFFFVSLFVYLLVFTLFNCQFVFFRSMYFHWDLFCCIIGCDSLSIFINCIWTSSKSQNNFHTLILMVFICSIMNVFPWFRFCLYFIMYLALFLSCFIIFIILFLFVCLLMLGFLTFRYLSVFHLVLHLANFICDWVKIKVKTFLSFDIFFCDFFVYERGYCHGCSVLCYGRYTM